jgi:molybdenum cofactor cytidylyltransferase
MNASGIAGVILAAGGSDRLGCPKQLLSWEGKPFVRQVALRALEADLFPVFVVTGAHHQEMEKAVFDLPVEIVYNPDWEKGMSTTMKAGLCLLPEACEGVIFLLSDQPQVSPLLLRGLIEFHTRHHAPITAPQVAGQRGNPVLFGRETFDALMRIKGDTGGRPLFTVYEVDWLPWIDARILMDVDTDEDLEALRQAYRIKD